MVVVSRGGLYSPAWARSSEIVRLRRLGLLGPVVVGQGTVGRYTARIETAPGGGKRRIQAQPRHHTRPRSIYPTGALHAVRAGIVGHLSHRKVAEEGPPKARLGYRLVADCAIVNRFNKSVTAQACDARPLRLITASEGSRAVRALLDHD